MEDELILSEQDRQKLDGIVQQMIDNNESDEDIQFVVNDFKNKYGANHSTPKPTPTSEPENIEPVQKEQTISQNRTTSVTSNNEVKKGELPLTIKVKKAYKDEVGGLQYNEQEYNVKDTYDQYTALKNQPLSEEELTEIDTEVNDLVANKGVWNNTKRFIKSAYNKMTGQFDDSDIALKDERKQAVEEFKKDNIPYNEDKVINRAKQIYKEKRIASLKESKEKDFMADIPNEVRDVLKQYEKQHVSSFSENDKELITKRTLIEKDIVSNQKILITLKEEKENLKKKGLPIPNNLDNIIKQTEQKQRQNLTDYTNNFKAYYENKENLGTAQDNLDAFKRDYGFLTNFAGNIGATTLDLGAGLVGVGAYIENIKGEIYGAVGLDFEKQFSRVKQKEFLDASKSVQQGSEWIRERIAKNTNVDDINTVNDFVINIPKCLMNKSKELIITQDKKSLLHYYMEVQKGYKLLLKVEF